jgi:hypothetical protein
MRRTLAIGDLARQATHWVVGPRRIYLAARRAGAGPDAALEALRISHAAALAARHGRGIPGRTNALRHFLWQALLTARLGVETARAVALAQEADSSRRRDSRVDHHNNVVGQEHGAAHADELREGTPRAAAQRLVPVALAKWDAGELIWVRPH